MCQKSLFLLNYMAEHKDRRIDAFFIVEKPYYTSGVSTYSMKPVQVVLMTLISADVCYDPLKQLISKKAQHN